VGADLAVDVLTCAGGHRHVVHRGQRLRGDTRNGVRMCWACWMGWTPGGRAWLGEWDRHQGWEAYARAHHNVLGQGRKYDSSIWYRHLACGKVVPKWQHDPRKGWPPYCIVCDDGNLLETDRKIPDDAPDLLYLVKFWPRSGVRFVKVGRTQPMQPRLRDHLGLPAARLDQVVEARHDLVKKAENEIKKACAVYRVEWHGYDAFGTAETFRLAALPLIGDLASWIHPTGRGVKDRTIDYLM